MANSMPIINNDSYNIIANELVKQFFGYVDAEGNPTEVGNIDVSQLGDYGKKYADLNDSEKQAFFSQMGALVTTQIFATNKYKSQSVDITKGFGNKYTGIIQKNRMRPQRSAIDTTSVDMADGSTTDPYVYHAFEIETTYFMDFNTESFEWSIPDKVFKGFVLGEQDFRNLIAMIEENISTEIKKHIDLSSQALINQTAAIVINDNRPTQVINILKKYNETQGVTLTTEEALTTPEFNRFAIYTINNTLDQMGARNTLNNFNNWESQTVPSDAHILFNAQWINGLNQYLLGDTFNTKFMELPTFKKMYAWQGSGSVGDLLTNTTIDLTIEDPINKELVEVKQKGVLGMIFNKDAVSIYNPDYSTEAQRDHQRRVWNYFTDVSFSTMIDLYEDFVVFTIDDGYLTETPALKTFESLSTAKEVDSDVLSKTKSELVKELEAFELKGLKSKTKQELIDLYIEHV